MSVGVGLLPRRWACRRCPLKLPTADTACCLGCPRMTVNLSSLPIHICPRKYTHTHTHIHTHTHTRTHTYTYMYRYARVYRNVSSHIHICAHCLLVGMPKGDCESISLPIHICPSKHTHTYKHTHMHTHAHIYIHVYICIRVYIRKCIHIYMQTLLAARGAQWRLCIDPHSPSTSITSNTHTHREVKIHKHTEMYTHVYINVYIYIFV